MEVGFVLNVERSVRLKIRKTRPLGNVGEAFLGGLTSLTLPIASILIRCGQQVLRAP
jgi:hypothetical protein